MASTSVAHVRISISGAKFSECLADAIRPQMPKAVDAGAAPPSLRYHRGRLTRLLIN